MGFSIDEAVRLVKLREDVKWGTLEALKDDGMHKLSEAYTQVAFCMPSMFDDDQTPYWKVSVYSYVLGHNNRMHEWSAKTLDAALAKAEQSIDGWVEQYRIRAFERDVANMLPDSEDCEDRDAKRPSDPEARGDEMKWRDL